MDLTALFKLSYGLYVVGVKTEKGLGGNIVDAIAQVAAGNAPMVMLASMKNNYTNESIKKSGEFALSVLPDNVDPFVIANFGFQSARVAEKWANVPHKVKDGLPLLDNAAAYLRLRVANTMELPTHTMFICDVVDGEQGENTAHPLIYGDYQVTMKSAAMEAFQKFKASNKPPINTPLNATFRWRCTICGFIYDGVVPFDELPDNWQCPVCGAPKQKFEKVSF